MRASLSVNGPTHVSPGLPSLLEEIALVILESRSALLENRLRDLQASILRQRGLCEECAKHLGDLVGASEPELVNSALRARQEGRIFAALLRRMSSLLEKSRNARLGPSSLYEAPNYQVPKRY